VDLRKLTWLISGIVAALAASPIVWRAGRFGNRAFLSRRSLLKIGGLGLAGLLTGAWRRRPSLDVLPSTSAFAAVCMLSPEQTEGPYYIPREKIRGNISEHKPGTPLELRFTVVDAATCRPIKNAAVDIWHCDAGGIYSGFVQASTGGPPGGNAGPTDHHTFLRGIQFTDARGHTRFQTIYPGWYRGRTVHVHVKVHLNHDSVGHVVHTGQLYFDDRLTAKVYQTGAYRERAAARDTFNNTDSIYRDGGLQSTLAIKRSGHGGYIGSITLGVHRY
jgi:protocatechuate 3,4-dioxygenase beta subunit